MLPQWLAFSSSLLKSFCVIIMSFPVCYFLMLTRWGDMGCIFQVFIFGSGVVENIFQKLKKEVCFLYILIALLILYPFSARGQRHSQDWRMARIHFPRHAVWFYDSNSPVHFNFFLWLDFPNSTVLCNGPCVMTCVRYSKLLKTHSYYFNLLFCRGDFCLDLNMYSTEAIFKMVFVFSAFR